MPFAPAHARVMKLGADLLRATSPGSVPDENFRPTYWSDRIYWLLVKANIRWVSSLNWNTSAESLAGDIAQQASRGQEWFEPLEAVVAAALKERGM